MEWVLVQKVVRDNMVHKSRGRLSVYKALLNIASDGPGFVAC